MFRFWGKRLKMHWECVTKNQTDSFSRKTMWLTKRNFSSADIFFGVGICWPPFFIDRHTTIMWLIRLPFPPRFFQPSSRTGIFHYLTVFTRRRLANWMKIVITRKSGASPMIDYPLIWRKKRRKVRGRISCQFLESDVGEHAESTISLARGSIQTCIHGIQYAILVGRR